MQPKVSHPCAQVTYSPLLYTLYIVSYIRYVMDITTHEALL